MTRSLFVDAVAKMECPRCKATPGNVCRSPAGRKTREPHGERCRALTYVVGHEPYSVPTMTATERFKADFFWIVGPRVEIDMPVEPQRVWSVLRYTDPDRKPPLPFKPIHAVTAFLEDHVHDWHWRNGKFRCFSRLSDGGYWVYVEFP